MYPRSIGSQLVLLLFGVAVFWIASSPVEASGVQYKVSVYKEAPQGLSVEDVASLGSQQDGPFVAWDSNISLGYSSADSWVKFEFDEIPISPLGSGSPQALYIRFHDSSKLMVLHYPSPNGQWAYETSGSSLPFYQWPVRDNQVSFRLDDKLGSKPVLYMMIRSSGPKVIAHKMHWESDYERVKLLEGIFWGIIIGVASFAMLYNVAIWLYSRDPAYLYYILFCLSVISWDLILKGYYRYLFPTMDNYDFLIAYINLNAAIIGMSIIQFMRKFVDFSRIAPRFDVFFKWVFYSYLLVIGLKIFNVQFYLISSVMAVVVFVSGITAFIGLFIGLMKRDRAATFLAFAWIPGVAIAVITVPTYYGQLPATWLNINMVPLASTIAIILFSAALGDKINTLRKQRDELQEKEYQRVVELSDRLKEVDGLKDVFLAKTSHELRTPLHGIIGLAEVLQRQEGNGNNTKATLSVIIQSGKRLVSLVDDILDFSKIKSGRFEINRSPTSLAAILDVVVTMSKPLCDDKGLELEVENLNNLPLVLADENRIQQILFNLVGNAIKFTSEGGVSISVAESADSLLVSVSDTGMGISEEEMKQVFTPFQQGKRASEQHIIGTGIGLALSKQLIELHGGKLEIDSAVGKGTCIQFSLQTAKSDSAPAASAPVIENRQTSQPQRLTEITQNEMVVGIEGEAVHLDEGIPQQTTILVVDDDPVNRNVIEGVLVSERVEVISCSGGQQALDLIERNEKIDLILLDIMMPGLSGFEVCQRVRKTKSPEQLPIIFLSAKGQIDDINHGFKLGANDYMIKPFSADELIIRVEFQLKTLRVKQLFDALYAFSKSIGKVKNLSHMVSLIAEHCVEKFHLQGAVAVVDGEIKEQLGVFTINQKTNLEFLAKENESGSSTIYLDSDSDGKLVSTLTAMLGIDASDYHVVALVWEIDDPSFLVLFRSLEQGPIAAVEKQYVKSLFEQSLQHFDNARALISDKYLFQAVNTVEEMLDEIVYIQSCPPYCTLHFDVLAEKSKDVRANLSSIDNYFSENSLIKVHRSYMVHTIFVDEVIRENRDYKIILKDKSGQKTHLPVARSQVKNLKSRYTHWFKS